MIKTTKTTFNKDASTNQIQFDFRSIPVFGKTTPEIQTELDTIVAAFDKNNPESGIVFGENCLKERNEIAQRMFDEQIADQTAFIREPLQKMLDFISLENMQEMGTNVARVIGQGVGVAKRNPSIILGAAALSTLSIPAALLGGGIALTLKEKAAAMKRKDSPPSADELAQQIQANMAAFKPMIRNLEIAKTQIQLKRSNINNLGRHNLIGAMNVTLHIAAGREILRQLNEEDIPATDNTGDWAQKDSYEKNALGLASKLSILENARHMAITDMGILATLSHALSQTETDVASVINHEAKNYMSNLATQGEALESYRMTGLVKKFRENSEKGTAQAIQLAKLASDSAAAGRVDSPERLQATLENIQKMRTVLSTTLNNIPALEAKQNQLKLQIDQNISGLIDDQIKLTKYQAANNNVVNNVLLSNPEENATPLIGKNLG